MDRVPEIRAIGPSGCNDIEQLVVGQQVDIHVYEDDPHNGTPMTTPFYGHVDAVTRDVLRRLGLEDDRSLSAVCRLVAQVAIKELAIGDGFDVLYGKFPNYSHRVGVDLRSSQPTDRQAQVTSTRQEVGEQ